MARPLRIELSNEKNVEIWRYFRVNGKWGVKGCRNQDKKR